MAKKFSGFTDGLTSQSPADTLVGLDLSQPANAQNTYWTLNSLFSVITRNITDGALRFQGFTAPSVSAAGQGSLYFDSSSNTFKISQNGGAYADIHTGVITVPQGGTGLTSLTTYALLAGGTSTTGNVQQVGGVGSAGQVLTSNGAGTLPSWQNVAAGGGISAAVVGNLIVANSVASGTDSGIASTVVARKPVAANVIQYVTPQGSDSNDGLSWGTSKLTIGGAYDAIRPSGGGTIYYTNGCQADTSLSYGLWLMGVADPNNKSISSAVRASNVVTLTFSTSHSFIVGQVVNVWDVANSSFVGRFTITGTPSATSITYAQTGADASSSGGRCMPGGWRPSAVTMNLVGVSSTTAAPVAQAPGASITGPSPRIWLSNVNRAYTWENILINGGTEAVRIGVDSDGALNNFNAGSSTQRFINLQTLLTQNANDPTIGPGVTVGCNCFWIWFEHSSLGGHGWAPLNSDNHAALLIDPDGGTSSSVYVTDTNLVAGGIRFNAGASQWYFVFRNIIQEPGSIGQSLPLMEPTIHATVDTFGNGIIDNIVTADGLGGSVVVEGNGSESVVVCGSGPVSGRAVVLNRLPSLASVQYQTPFAMGQTGFFKGNIVGVRDPRNFAPNIVRYANLINTDPSTWSAAIGSATVTTGQLAPDGSLNAATLSTASAVDFRQVYRATRSIAVGDWFILAGWTRGASSVADTASVVNGNAQIAFPADTSYTNGTSITIAGVPYLIDLNYITVSVTNGLPTVTTSGGGFNVSWAAGTNVTINGVNYTISSVASPSSLTLSSNFTGATSSSATCGVGTSSSRTFTLRVNYAGSTAAAAVCSSAKGGIVNGAVLEFALLTGTNKLTNNSSGFFLDSPQKGDGEWEWLVGAQKLMSTTVASSEMYAALYCRTGASMGYYLPIFLHIPASAGLSDNEVMEIVQYLQSYPNTAPTGGIYSAPISFLSKAGNPSTSDIAASTWAIYKNTSSGVLSLWANDGGVMKSVALT